MSSRPTAFAAWVQVRAEALTPDALLEALRDGAYYSSRGPELQEVALTDGHLTVRCSPVSSIFVSGPTAFARQQHGESLTEATFDVAGFAGAYCRLTVIDADGKRAWSNPIWLS
jgi:hypothetical protein